MGPKFGPSYVGVWTEVCGSQSEVAGRVRWVVTLVSGFDSFLGRCGPSLIFSVALESGSLGGYSCFIRLAQHPEICICFLLRIPARSGGALFFPLPSALSLVPPGELLC